MNKLPFNKKNYQWMVMGVITLIAGFTIMTLDKEPHGFGFLGLTLGPIVVLIGFVLLWVLGILNMVLVIVATVKASEDKIYRYPFNLRLVK